MWYFDSLINLSQISASTSNVIEIPLLVGIGNLEAELVATKGVTCPIYGGKHYIVNYMSVTLSLPSYPLGHQVGARDNDDSGGGKQKGGEDGTPRQVGWLS